MLVILLAHMTELISGDWTPVAVMSSTAFAAVILMGASSVGVGRVAGKRAKWVLLRLPMVVALNVTATVAVGLVGEGQNSGVDTDTLRIILWIYTVLILLFFVAAVLVAWNAVRGLARRMKAEALVVAVLLAPVSSWAIIASVGDEDVSANGSLPTLAVVALTWLLLQSMIVSGAAGRDLTSTRFVVLDDGPVEEDNGMHHRGEREAQISTGGGNSVVGAIAGGVLVGVVVGLALRA